MKRFILKITIFFALLVTIDALIGGSSRLYKYVKGGEIGKAHEIMESVQSDIVILGSSRAAHHYNSEIIARETGLKTYNAGFDGKGTMLEYGLLKGIMSRKKPKIIVCDLTPTTDIYVHASSATIDVLAPYVDKYGLDTIFIDLDSTERWKIKSNAYRYNSKLVRILCNSIIDRSGNIDGYQPLEGEFNGKIRRENLIPQNDVLDPVKLKYVDKIANLAKENGITLIYVISPSLKDVNPERYKYQIEFAKAHNISVFNHLQDTAITNHPEYFRDVSHMNHKGADAFTEIFINDLKTLDVMHKKDDK